MAIPDINVLDKIRSPYLYERLSILKISQFVFPLMLSSSAVMAQVAASPEQVLADAARYTVKIKVQNEIAFNQDEAGSASGTGFLVDRERGWLLTNAHVATRSPSVIKVSFKDGEQIEAKRLHVDLG